jgi:hypothetical protein
LKYVITGTVKIKACKTVMRYTTSFRTSQTINYSFRGRGSDFVDDSVRTILKKSLYQETATLEGGEGE